MSNYSAVELASMCQTCNGDGSRAHMFDGNCPAAWAHRFVQPPLFSVASGMRRGPWILSKDQGAPARTPPATEKR